MMMPHLLSEVRQDCLLACALQSEVRQKLALQHIAVTGGTGFLGTWIAEMVAALNDEYQLGITIDLFARNTAEWTRQYPHLANRPDIKVKSQDVRSSFEFSRNTRFVIHAAGIPNNRVHASDPLRVQQTTTIGISNALEAATKLDNLIRFLNVSSCLVNGFPDRLGALTESECFSAASGQLHNVYLDSKRSAESLAAIYRSQFRLPVSTIRPFTFAGPYQSLDGPWAINNFLRDALTGSEIRIHGNGQAKRSYLYGSDAAWWTLVALIYGMDGGIYNIGSSNAITHLDLVNLISKLTSVETRTVLNTGSLKHAKYDDLYPNLSLTSKELSVAQTCSLEKIIDKSYRWFSAKY